MKVYKKLFDPAKLWCEKIIVQHVYRIDNDKSVIAMELRKSDHQLIGKAGLPENNDLLCLLFIVEEGS